MVTFIVNGKSVKVNAEPDTPLLWGIREHLRLTGTKYGCGAGLCGACTVHINGKAVKSCQTDLADVDGKEVTTIEGLSPDTTHPLQKAWIAEQVPQCGYCQTGMIMAAAALLDRDPKPSDKIIDRSITNICRCGTYNQVREAIHRASVFKEDV